PTRRGPGARLRPKKNPLQIPPPAAKVVTFAALAHCLRQVDVKQGRQTEGNFRKPEKWCSIE
ncbi:hypothetical protein, partial [Pseudomonas aeruginosa]|uniref:hypothetical protein n=1 Tax=Pseudomonas aeruginosa TaxID=287 RepID=UPI001C95FA81